MNSSHHPGDRKGKSLWNAIVSNGGQESECGWCKDRWGLSWQITPRALTDAVMGTDPAAAKRAFDTMMTMKKIDVAAIEAARRGGALKYRGMDSVADNVRG